MLRNEKTNNNKKINTIVKFIEEDEIEKALEAIEVLDKEDINQPSTTSFEKLTLLEVACIKGQVEVVAALLDKGANANLKNNFSAYYPLHHVIWESKNNEEINDRLKILALFEEHQADFNVTDGIMRTALHIAIAQKSFAYIEPLITYGVKLNAKDQQGETVLDYTMNNPALKNIKEMLMEKKAESGTKPVSFSNKEKEKEKDELTVILDDLTVVIDKSTGHRRFSQTKKTNSNKECQEKKIVEDNNTTNVDSPHIKRNLFPPVNPHKLRSLRLTIEKNNPIQFDFHLKSANKDLLDSLIEQMPSIPREFLEKINAKINELNTPTSTSRHGL